MGRRTRRRHERGRCRARRRRPPRARRAEPEPTLYYGTLDDFVRDVVSDLYRRRVGPRAEFRWSARWWRSSEALVRLEAMWRSWENLRRDPALGMSVWLLQHGDPQIRALMDPTGPFAGSDDINRTGDPLPYATPPEGLFTEERETHKAGLS